jgi:hypothetical protein
MKRILKPFLAVMTALLLAGCGKYISSYKATGFIHTNLPSSAEMSFWSFEGRMVFKLHSHCEGNLKYKAELESGSAVVSYDYNGSQEELFTLSAGEELESSGGYIEAGTVYVIVETDGWCRHGKIRVWIE